MLQYYIGITLIFSTISCQELTIRNLQNDLILMQKTTLCQIQTGNIRIVHPINITEIEVTINLLTNLVYHKQRKNNALIELSKHKIRELYSNFVQIKPASHQRHRRMDAIGTMWKWIAGSPDAEDSRIIYSNLNQLINENNHQVKINNQIDKRISALTNTINQIIDKQQINQIVLDELDVITTIINIDTLNKIITSIQEAMLFSRIHVTSNGILTSQEIHLIKDIINNQGVQLNIPEEALNFVTPKLVMNENTLLYILHVPELEKEKSTIIRIYPLNKNGTVIKSYPQFLIKQAKRLFTTSKPEEYVQLQSYIREFNDSCIHPLIMGTEPLCLMETKNETTALLISNNKMLITNAQNNELQSDCGPHNGNLSGNLVISFSNCTIAFMGHHFTSKEKITENETILGAFHNLNIKSELSKNYDVEKIEKATLINRNKLDEISLRHETDWKWKWSLLGGTSLTSVLLFITLYLILFHLRAIHIRATKRNQRRRSSKSTNQNNPSSAEDDTFSPPPMNYVGTWTPTSNADA
ncbi:uncharacterized protein LOC131682778 [Topomyia yanbarensis]|uniref:uncharacterized protein LOC131682778 n=1 Tax=Topomyia yanbarensis TaxID=2498891 RepID=UPI00273AA5F3|nr:uncharacterized protein LOC131682778 [Topomyia yanbarensis]